VAVAGGPFKGPPPPFPEIAYNPTPPSINWAAVGGVLANAAYWCSGLWIITSPFGCASSSNSINLKIDDGGPAVGGASNGVIATTNQFAFGYTVTVSCPSGGTGVTAVNQYVWALMYYTDKTGKTWYFLSDAKHGIRARVEEPEATAFLNKWRDGSDDNKQYTRDRGIQGNMSLNNTSVPTQVTYSDMPGWPGTVSAGFVGTPLPADGRQDAHIYFAAKVEALVNGKEIRGGFRVVVHAHSKALSQNRFPCSAP
jgi:hypothetical protein